MLKFRKLGILNYDKQSEVRPSPETPYFPTFYESISVDDPAKVIPGKETSDMIVPGP